jgi:hypothetical protein
MEPVLLSQAFGACTRWESPFADELSPQFAALRFPQPPPCESDQFFKFCQQKLWLDFEPLAFSAWACAGQESSLQAGTQDGLTLMSAHQIAMDILEAAEDARERFLQLEAGIGLSAEIFK